VKGKGTGRHVHTVLVDDPIKPLDAIRSQGVDSAELNIVKSWWRSTIPTRRADPEKFSRVVVMQRLHEDDLAGVCLDEKTFEHLSLPMRFDPAHACKYDLRTCSGELLFPSRFPESAVADLEKQLGGAGSIDAEAQLQQNPSPPGGSTFKAEHFKRFTLDSVSYESTFSVLSVDAAFKDEAISSDVALEVWGRLGPNSYCFESVSDNLDIDGTLDACRLLLARFKVNAILIEDKANGPAIISILRKRLPNVIAVNPRASKEARAMAASVFYKAGSVYHLNGAAWLPRKENNLIKFPRGRKNDDVDATSQALLYLEDCGNVDFLAAMESFSAEKSMFEKMFSVR
jgi:predicted phage terminase large subunit-like protein